MSAEWNDEQKRQVQRLALRGYDFDASSHLVLEVKDASHARKFLGSVLRERGWLTFGERDRVRKDGGEDDREPAVSIGFTYRGLQALGVPDRYLNELRVKAPAFCEGAPARAALRLGDAGPCAAERWEPMFAFDRAHVLISIHGPSRGAVDAMAERLADTAGGRAGFKGWEGALPAEHLTQDKRNRTVHFGFRDNLARPRIVEGEFEPSKLRHHAGELVLGYLNDAKFNRWDDGCGLPDVAQFFRNGSFAVLRKIEQNEEAFDNYLNQQADDLDVKTDYLKAKLCGRWPNGARVTPGHELAEPSEPKQEDCFDFTDDTEGFGCPFGAHIRRTNPRGDSIAPARLRPLFRRGMPYGPKYCAETKHKKRGLIGLFFCASIEDQFEIVMSEWVEKKPMGPRNLGNSKDPLVGHHDDEAFFHIPKENGPGIKLTGFEPFVTTRGTLYALFPSLSALRGIARMESAASPGAQPGGAKRQTGGAPRSGDGTRPEHGTTQTEAYTAPNDRFCDIVMEGGVTSGIIYASAVTELAKSYRFSSIGGSSIGAFAAALTAAAEYSRRLGSNAGFKLMERLPTDLADEDDRNETRLLRMFRPQDGTRRLFKIFLASLDRKSTFSRLVCGLTEAVRQYWRAVILALVATAVLVLSGPLVLTWLGWSTPPPYGFGLRVLGLGSWVLALLIALAFAVALTLFLGIAWDFRRQLVPNGFGLCRGWSEEERMDSPDLTGFLHASIQLAAGRNPIDDQPLTFADLRDAPGRATDVLGQPNIRHAPPSINLQVYSTNLAHGRPYRFPLDPADDMGRLFFRVDDLKPYFPQPILKHLVGYALPYHPQTFSDPEVSAETEQYLELPTNQLPIVVAARLAMSFPLLISAVPLWAIDYEAPIGRRGFAPCWMSDGGLCSNFPIHLFDSFVPKWPTFGIALQNRSKNRPDECVWLPEKHYEGRGDTWDRFAESKEPLGRLAGFLVSLWLAAWRWNDSTMMRMPGVRDRVVRIFLEEGEGGVNIKMSKQAIDALTQKYGKPAAAAFLKKFADDNSPGWPEHRWVRFNRLLIALRQQIEGFKFAADLDRYAPPLSAQIEESRKAAPLRGASRGCPSASEKSLSERQALELEALLAALSDLEKNFQKAADCRPYVAVPRPSMRVRHPT